MTGDMPQNLAPMLVTAGPLPTPDEDFAHEINGTGVRSLRPPEIVVRMPCDQGFLFALDYRKGVEIW